jgi:gliding motility-associated-like protein
MKACFCIICLCIFASIQLFAQQIVSPGEVTEPIIFNTAGCAYNWSNDHPEIGLPASGQGNLPSFTAINNTTSTIVANIRADIAGFMYVPDHDDNKVSSRVRVINLTDYQSLPSIDNGGNKQPVYQTVSKDGKWVYILSSRSAFPVSINHIIKINTVDHSVKIVSTGFDVPVLCTVSNDGKRLYVTFRDGSTNSLGILKVYNTTDLSEIKAIKLVAAANLIVSPDDSKLYVIGDNSLSEDVLYEMNTSTYSYVSYPIGPRVVMYGMAISPDGKEIFMNKLREPPPVISSNNNVIVFNTNTKTLTHEIEVGKDVWDYAMSEDGKTLYVANQRGGGVSVIDIPTKTVRYTIPFTAAFGPLGIDLSADGRQLIVLAPQLSRVFVYNTADNQPITDFPYSYPLALGDFIATRSCSTINATITVEPTVPPPNVSVSGNLTTLRTVYGTPSATTGFTVSASSLSGGIQIDAPQGFQVSIDNTAFSKTVTIPHNGGVIAGQFVYVRLAATTPAGEHLGNVRLKALGKSAILIPIPNSTVTKAPLTVTANDARRNVGGRNPLLTYSFSGFVNGEDKNSLASLPAITTMAQFSSPPGTYPINVSGGLADNYELSYVAGTLTVTTFGGLIIPNTFTPNADGINDLWVIKNIEQMPDCVVDVFNRFGQKVFTSVGYATPWDGKVKGGKHVPPGVYYYVIDLGNDIGRVAGSVTVIR